MQNMQSRISTDKFGNPYQVVGLKDKKGTGYPKGYIKLGGKLYKIEVTESQKEGVHAWVRVTKVNQSSRQQSM